MSGTSLDGVDIAFCRITHSADTWTYEIEAAETISYSKHWQNRLQNLENSTSFDYALTNVEYGHYLGKLVSSFIRKNKLKPDFVSSHGHTIFHQPDKLVTSQIGSGAAIAAECDLPVVCDFRTKDVALGGQGAPLVPIGDALLFSDFGACLNIGGFANISFGKKNKRVAFDICPANIVLNTLSQKLGEKFDSEGRLARRGKVNTSLLKKLNSLSYYKKNSPKSLGKEWVIETIFPLLSKSGLNPFDQLSTFTEHVAMQIASSIHADSNKSRVLITGGGVYNLHLIERIKNHCKNTIVIPDKKTIEFKEALVFALLGILRWRGEVNCFSSVTGSTADNIGGCIYL